jgi:hypothetical protein
LNIDYKGPQLYYNKSDELLTADEKVKKILSLEFATGVKAKSNIKPFYQDLIFYYF